MIRPTTSGSNLAYFPPARQSTNDCLELSRAAYVEQLRQTWRQGEHIAIYGRTGRGKTYLIRDIAALRGWVAVLAVKRADDTLQTFPSAGYRIIKSWPPRYEDHRVLVWAKPKTLHDVVTQQVLVSRVLDDVFVNGGWTVVLDDVARIAKRLHLDQDIASLLSEARSHHSSVLSAMTQPSSMTQRIPSEVWRQVRFHFAFYYRVGRDLEVISDIVGYTKNELKRWMSALRPFDFLAFDDLTDTVTIVRS